MEVDNPNPVVTTLAKLELVNEIRTKTLRMLKMKEKLIETIESSKREDNYLKEYRCEMDLLLQEKMAHVEELRQIHSDINSMEAVIKQTEISRVNSLDRVKKIYSEFAPIKNEVDRLRQSCLGLERLPELHEEDPEFNLSDFMLEDKQKTIWQPQIKPAAALVENLIIPMANPAAKIHHHQSHHQQHQPQKQTPASSFVNMNTIRETQGSGGKNVVERVNENQNQMMAPSFTRQAPPPMKSCLSCHQQIHRNAPICPLCKAKSRSRNPKKPKNKKDQH